jgi:GT2 family glycosyltransferase
MKDIQNKPLVSVITINYDQPEVTCALLESLRKITYTPIEIIVVDNASPTKEPDPIKEQYPEIHLIRSDKNLGFAGGNNIGIKAATGEYFLLINNDTEVEPDFLEPLVSKLESDFNIGAVSPKIRYFNQKELIQFAGYTEMNPVTIRNQGIGFQEIDRGQYDQDAPTYFLFGAAMLIPRRIFQKVGLMADIFFLYYEEIDWFHRIRNAGYQLYYIHNSLVYHKDSVTTGSGSPMKI